MSDRLYGGIRAGRTGVSLAVLLRRDDTMKGLTGVVPAAASPAFVNGVATGDTGTTSPTVFTFTPGAGSNYLVVRYNVLANVRPSSVVAIPTAGGTTVNLTEIGTKYRSTIASVTLGGWAGPVLPGIEYSITVTWESSNSNAALWAAAYSNVGSIGTPAGAEHGGGASPSVPPLNVNTGGPTGLCIDLGASPGGSPAMTPNSGQTAENAMSQDGAGQAYIRPSNKIGTGVTAMTWSITGPGTGAAWGVALLPVPGGVITAAYARHGAAAVDIPLTAITPAAAWTAGGWAELDPVKLPGAYRLDVPDAAGAAGADWTVVEVVAAGAIEYVERLGLETRRALRAGGVYPGLMFTLEKASDGTPLAGATVTATRYLDGAAGAAMSNAVVEIAGGLYKVDLAAVDTAALFAAYVFTAALARPRTVLFILEP